jgi:hypothetical protein
MTNDEHVTTMPSRNIAVGQVIADDANRNPARTAPTFPPAPTIPVTLPKASRFRNGATA